MSDWVSFSTSVCLSVSTPAPALVTKATSKVPLSLRVPWDTPRLPSRAPSTPTRRTVTEAPCSLWNQQRSPLLLIFSSCSLVLVEPCLYITLVQLSHPPFPVALTFHLLPVSLQQHWDVKANTDRNQKNRSRKLVLQDKCGGITQTENYVTYKRSEEPQLCSYMYII